MPSARRVGGRPAARITGGPEVYLRELGWREFANHLLYHFPHTTDAPLRADYAKFPWANDPVGLRAWQRGRTGFRSSMPACGNSGPPAGCTTACG
jgi:deoxyribodipyrimidine photolyase